MTKKVKFTSEQLSDLIVQSMLEKKAKDIVVLDLRKVKNAITDYFIICSGTSDTQIDAIAGFVEHELEEKYNERAWHREGKQVREWVLIDYVDVVAHVFRKDRRDFYDLENLWGDAVVKEIKESFDNPVLA
jgi:ribosome-associated protein